MVLSTFVIEKLFSDMKQTSTVLFSLFFGREVSYTYFSKFTVG